MSHIRRLPSSLAKASSRLLLRRSRRILSEIWYARSNTLSGHSAYHRFIGTICAKKNILGGRSIDSQRFCEETMEETTKRQTDSKSNASASLGIDPFLSREASRTSFPRNLRMGRRRKQIRRLLTGLDAAVMPLWSQCECWSMLTISS